MRKTLLLTVLLIMSVCTSAQDIVFLKNGQKINCKVLDSDSIRVNIILELNSIQTYLSKSEVSGIHYGNQVSENYNENNLRYAVTIGILQGGGSLIGFDCETLITDRFGFQLGAGVIGFGAGFNLHFKPGNRNSFISLQYWHQGFADTYTESLIGPSFVFRGRKWLTAQIGLGYVLEKGPGWPEETKLPSAILTYSIGAYFPF